MCLSKTHPQFRRLDKPNTGEVDWWSFVDSRIVEKLSDRSKVNYFIVQSTPVANHQQFELVLRCQDIIFSLSALNDFMVFSGKIHTPRVTTNHVSPQTTKITSVRASSVPHPLRDIGGQDVLSIIRCRQRRQDYSSGG